jgi:hypothetical protein
VGGARPSTCYRKSCVRPLLAAQKGADVFPPVARSRLGQHGWGGPASEFEDRTLFSEVIAKNSETGLGPPCTTRVDRVGEHPVPRIQQFLTTRHAAAPNSQPPSPVPPPFDLGASAASLANEAHRAETSGSPANARSTEISLAPCDRPVARMIPSAKLADFARSRSRVQRSPASIANSGVSSTITLALRMLSIVSGTDSGAPLEESLAASSANVMEAVSTWTPESSRYRRRRPAPSALP